MLDHVLEGMNAVVIGGSGGIGLAIAQRLQEAGATVAILGRTQEKLGQAAATLRRDDPRARALRVDVTDWAQFQEASVRIEQEFCSVDILVNSAPEQAGRDQARVHGRFRELEELAASPSASFVTGAVMNVDRGYFASGI